MSAVRLFELFKSLLLKWNRRQMVVVKEEVAEEKKKNMHV